MPISREGKPYFTENQLQYARGQTSTLEYVMQQGYPLVKKGTYYVHAEHDSLVFAPNGSWYWNSHDMHGNAIDFITQFEHKSLIEAVLILNGENVISKSAPSPTPQEKREPIEKPDYTRKQMQEASATFELPPKASNYSRLFGYLCKGRGIDSAIVQQLVKEHKLYLSATPTKNGKEINNVVFVGYDENGVAKNAYQRGTWAPEGKPAFKVDVAGSDKNHPFHMVGTGNSLIVFEGAIDAMSHATLVMREQGAAAANEPHRISLGGVFHAPLMQFLKVHPEIKHICLALDNDAAGIAGTKTLITKLVEAGYSDENISAISSQGKDFNTDLMNLQEQRQDSFTPNTVATAEFSPVQNNIEEDAIHELFDIEPEDDNLSEVIGADKEIGM